MVFGNFVDPPSLLVSLKRAIADLLYPPRVETTAARVEVAPIWSESKSRLSQILSVAMHAAVILLLILPAAVPALILPPPRFVAMLTPPPPLVLPAAGQSSGGGGGGMKAPRPASKGELPRGADKQLLPPMVEAKNLAPNLIVEPTIVAPQLANLPQFSFLTIGDPNGVAGPPSPGPGIGGGIGNGTGPGVGNGKGPGAGDGEGGGTGGGPYNIGIGGGITPPTVIYQPPPEYSDDARKARIQGTVEILGYVNADGTLRVDSVRRGLGFGLDQKAIEAVLKWKFKPATQNGKPIAMPVLISVNFTIR